MAADLADVVGSPSNWLPAFGSEFAVSVSQSDILAVTFDHSPISLLRAVNAANEESRLATRASSLEDAAAPTVLDARISTDGSSDLALAATSVSNNSVVSSEVPYDPEEWWLPVSDESSIAVDLEVVDANGDVVTSVVVGERFTLNIYAQDLTQDAKGVFSAFMDISFDPQLASVAGELQHSPDYQLFKSGEVVAPGQVDNVGGGHTQWLDTTGTQRLLIASIRLEATGEGELTIQSSTAGVYPAYDLTLYGENQAIHPQSIDFGSVTIPVRAIPAPPAAGPVTTSISSNSDQHESDLVAARRTSAVIVGDATGVSATDDYFAMLPASDTVPTRPFTLLDESRESEFSSLAEALAELWQS